MLKLFKEVYLEQYCNYLPNGKRIIFSEIHGGENYTPIFDSDSITYVPFDLDILVSEKNFYDSFESIYHFIGYINEVGAKEKIIVYCDEANYLLLICSWIKNVYPNCSAEIALEYVFSSLIHSEKIYYGNYGDSIGQETAFKPMNIEADDFYKVWNTNSVGYVEEENQDFIKFWRLKNKNEFDITASLCNYFIDKSCKESIESYIKSLANENISSSKSEMKEYHKKRLTNKAYMEKFKLDTVSPSKMKKFIDDFEFNFEDFPDCFCEDDLKYLKVSEKIASKEKLEDQEIDNFLSNNEEMITRKMNMFAGLILSNKENKNFLENFYI